MKIRIGSSDILKFTTWNKCGLDNMQITCDFLHHIVIISQKTVLLLITIMFSCDLYNNWKSVYFFCWQTPPKRRIVRRPNLALRRVTTMSRTFVGFMSIGVVVMKIMTFSFFYSCGHVRLDSCYTDITSGNGSDGRPAVYQLAGWLPLH